MKKRTITILVISIVVIIAVAVLAYVLVVSNAENRTWAGQINTV